MSTTTRTFTVAMGRSLVLPRSLGAAPGGAHAAYRGGESFTLPAAKVDRFLRRRLAVGDVVEVKATAPAPAITRPKEG